MSRNTILLFVIGAITVIVAGASWYIYPEWRNDPAGVIGVGAAGLGGVLATIKGVADVLKSFKELNKREKTWEEAPLKRTSPEIIRGDMGRGGQVSFINRGATDENLLWRHPKVIITGQMKVGKTREAAEIIQRAIDDDLVAPDQVFEPSQTLRALDSSQLVDALRWELDRGKKILLFIDELPKEIVAGEEEKWDALLKALKRCPDFFVVATGRSDQLTPKQNAWLEKQDFRTIELRGLEEDDLDKLVLAAGGVFELLLSEEARKAFVDTSDGRPETTLIGMRRLAGRGKRKVDADTAKEVAEDSLEISWTKTLRYLETEYTGVKYWLNAIGTFYSANVDPGKTLVWKYASALWKKDERFRIGRDKLLKAALEKLEDYDIRERGLVLRYPEVIAEGRIDPQLAKRELKDFLVRYRQIWQGPVLKNFNEDRDSQAWALFGLARGAEGEKKYAEAVRLYSAAIMRTPFYGFYNNRGIILGDLGLNEQAIQDFDKAIELNPEYPDHYYNRGSAFDEQGEYEKAIQDYDRAIELKPEDAKAYANRGVSYYNQGEYEKAIQDFDMAIALNQEYAIAYANRGNIFYLQGEYEQAIQDFDRAIELNPEDADPYSSRGATYRNQGEYEKAIQDYDKAIELNPDDATIYYNRGNIFYLQGEHEKAIQDFDMAIELNPEDAEAYSSRAATYRKQGEYEKAIQDYDKTIELNPEDAMAYANRGLAYHKLEKYERAMQDYDKAIELNPENAIAYANRGWVYDEQGEYDKAIQDYDMAIELNPDDAISYSNRGSAYYNQGEYEKAIQDFDMAIALNPEYASAYYNRGWTYYEQGEYEKAIQDYDSAIELNPEDAKAYANRGVTYRNQGEYEKAIQDFDMAIELNPEDATTYYSRGITYHNQGKYEQAIQDFDKAIELNPEYATAYYNKACCYGLQGEVRQAVVWLRTALTMELEHYCRLTKEDSDFDGVRGEEEFVELMEEFCVRG